MSAPRSQQDYVLKSAEFRREREQSWRELEILTRSAEADGVASLDTPSLMRLPALYRATLSSLSVARSISLDQNVVSYLESLAARSYFAVYGARAGFWRSLYDFFAWRFPAGVRAAAAAVLLGFAIFMLGAATAFWLTLGNADWFYTFVPADLAGGRNPGATTEALRETLYTKPEDASAWLYSFAAFLFSHNARIAMLCFALGFALGVPVVLMIFYNGAILGAFIALFHDRGLSQELLGWLLIHGSTELLALWLCAGAGLVLGGAVAFPGRHARLTNLARRGRQASVVVMGAVFMLFIAGLLEGLGRQIVNDTAVRYLIGCGAFVVWMLYFTLAGRGRRDGGD